MFLRILCWGDTVKNKIIITTLCLLLCVFSVVSIVSANAATFIVYNEMKLEIPSATNKTEYYFEAYLGSETEFTVPDTVAGRTIVKINGNAFADTKVVTCTIPDTVTTIDGSAFLNCETLKSVNVPATVTSIGAGAFANCTSLTDVDFPQKSAFTIIPMSCFSGCSALEEVTIPDGVEIIYNYAFLNCTSLKKVTIPATVTSISAKVFKGCDNVTLYVYEGSYALEYAVANSIPYVNLGEYVEPTEPTTSTTAPTEVTTEATTVTVPDTTPTEPTGATVITDATEPSSTAATTPSSAVTEPTESSTATDGTTDATEPSSTATVTTDATEGSTGTTSGTEVTTPSSTAGGTTSSQPTSATATATVATSSAPIKSTYYIGDADLDGRISVKDATKIQKHLAKLLTLDEIPLTLADANNDTKVSVKDATQIQKYIAGFKDILFVGDEVQL